MLSAAATAAGGEGPVPFAAVWSLGIEEKFYMVWPLMFTAAILYRARIWVAVAGLAGLWTFTAIGPAAAVRFVSHYAPLLLGCVVACLLHHPIGYRISARLAGTAAGAVAAVLAAVLTWQTPRVATAIVFQCAVAVVLAYLVIRPHSVAARLLGSRPAAFLAGLSYALYLFHGLALKVALRLVGDRHTLLAALGELVVGLALAVPACWVLHVTVERPLQRFGQRRTEARPAKQAGPRHRAVPRSRAVPSYETPTRTADGAEDGARLGSSV